MPPCTSSFSLRPPHRTASCFSTLGTAVTSLLWNWSRGEFSSDVRVVKIYALTNKAHYTLKLLQMSESLTIMIPWIRVCIHCSVYKILIIISFLNLWWLILPSVSQKGIFLSDWMKINTQGKPNPVKVDAGSKWEGPGVWLKVVPVLLWHHKVTIVLMTHFKAQFVLSTLLSQCFHTNYYKLLDTQKEKEISSSTKWNL